MRGTDRTFAAGRVPVTAKDKKGAAGPPAAAIQNRRLEDMNMYSMPGYFQNMPTVGKELVNPNAENTDSLKAVENEIGRA